MTASIDQEPVTAKVPPELPKTTRPKVRHPTPDALADVVLIDATTCAAGGGMGVSWWHDEVRAGRAPAPAVREPRCTRWALASVRAFWIARAEQAANNAAAAERMRAQAAKASAKAKANRRALAATLAVGQQGAPE